MFTRKRANELVVGDVFFHGYGWGRFERYTQRKHDVVVHYRDTGTRAKKRSVRCETRRRFIVLSADSACCNT